MEFPSNNTFLYPANFVVILSDPRSMYSKEFISTIIIGIFFKKIFFNMHEVSR